MAIAEKRPPPPAPSGSTRTLGRGRARVDGPPPPRNNSTEHPCKYVNFNQMIFLEISYVHLERNRTQGLDSLFLPFVEVILLAVIRVSFDLYAFWF